MFHRSLCIGMLACGLAACAATPPRQGALPQWAVVGVGQASCTRFLEESGGGGAGAQRYLEWANGYVTGVNAQAPYATRVVDTAALNYDELLQSDDAVPSVWLERYCTEHPGANFQVAVDALLVHKYWNLQRREQREKADERRRRLDG